MPTSMFKSLALHRPLLKLRLPDREARISNLLHQNYSKSPNMMSLLWPQRKCRTSMLSDVCMMKWVVVNMSYHTFAEFRRSITIKGHFQYTSDADLESHYSGERPPRLNGPPLRDGTWDLIQRCWEEQPSKNGQE